jgi:hypothetical protein
MPTIQFDISLPEVEQVLAYLRALSSVSRVEVLPEEQVSPKSLLLTHEQLMALPMEERVAYCRLHGGPLAVMKANGFGFTEADIQDWHRYREERSERIAAMSLEEAWKEIYGE